MIAGPHRLVVCLWAIVSAAWLAFAGLWLFTDHSAYFAILRFWGFAPFAWPYVDTHGVYSAIQCWGEGVNVYQSNPCDVENRPHAYSPLWLRLSPLGLTTALTGPTGVALNALFFASVARLARPRSSGDLAIWLAALFSTAVVYGVERANIDLIIFALATLGGVWFARSETGRLAAYGLFAVGGFMKFYPFSLFFLSLVEDRRRFLIINGLLALALAAFAWTFRHELHSIAYGIARGSFSRDFFGASNLPTGLARLYPDLGLGEGAVMGLRLALCGLALAVAARISGPLARAGVRLDAATTTGALALIGCALMAGCFFAWQNIAYRGIYFLLLLPWLLELRRAPAPAARTVGGVAIALILFLMWGEFARLWLGVGLVGLDLAGTDPATAAARVFWLGRETVWWTVVTLLLALLVDVVRRAPVWPWRKTRQVSPIA